MVTAPLTELVVNILQLMVFSGCLAAAVYRLTREHDRLWLVLVWFYCCYLLTLSYWMVYLFAYEWTPPFGYVSSLGWTASYLFLLLFEAMCDERRAPQPPALVAWLPAAVCVPLCVLYCTYGDFLYNIACCSLMGAIGYYAIRGIVQGAPSSGNGMTASGGAAIGGLAGNRAVHAAVLGVVVATLSGWTASCFVDYSNPFNLYIVSDLFVSLMYLAIMFFALRAVRK